ncbi:CdaR family transcriptional regulator [Chryseomicrobium palamuruense]|uniref:CdaR family transcriptional regulator n=1 Tax=Chryseomicrobium palamuruense TaxID=682973 RepID=A0ABV8URN9_9BACL
MLTKELANQMVDQTMIRLHHNINVMDTSGRIFASGESIRLQQLHAGAAYVAKTGETLVIEETDIDKWSGSKAGINLPLYYKEKLVAVIGITGSPEELKPVASLVQLTCELLLHQSVVTSEAEWNRKWKDDAITELMMTERLSSETMERLSLAGFQFEAPMYCIVFHCEEKEVPALRRKFEDFFDWSDKVAGVSMTGELIAFTSRLPFLQLEERMNRFLNVTTQVTAAIGKEATSVQELARSLATARVARNHATGRITPFADVELMYLLDQVDPEERLAYAESILVELDAKAKETLRVLFQCELSIQKTADALGIHRHTLSYRIQQIFEETGYHPLHFSEARKLWLALHWLTK